MLVTDRVKLASDEQEAQLMMTNPRDAFRGQSRSPNIVTFHITSQNAVTLKTGLRVRQGHWKCHRSIERI